MPLRLKGNAPRPGEPDKRYYMIDVQEGKRRERISSGTRDKSLAERKEQAVLDALRADINVPREDLVALVRGQQRAAGILKRHAAAPAGATLKQLTQECLDHPKIWREISSKRSKRQNMAMVMEILGADTPVAAIDTDAVDRLIAECDRKGNSGATINHKLNDLRVVLKYALRQKHITTLPLFERQEGARKRKLILDPDMERAILDAVARRDEREASVKGGHPVKKDAHRYVTLFQFLIETGLRPAEAIRLPWSDVKLREGYVQIVHAVHRGTRTKTGTDRIVPLTDAARTLLEGLLGVIKGGPFRDLNLRRASDHWLEARRSIGIDDKDCVIYATRHTCATRLAEESGDLHLVKDWLGHSTITLTSNTYVHASVKHLTKGAELLNKRRSQVTPGMPEESPSRDRAIPETGTSATVTP